MNLLILFKMFIKYDNYETFHTNVYKILKIKMNRIELKLKFDMNNDHKI
jgi:hypothetical protein